jgi:hypothetical protein
MQFNATTKIISKSAARGLENTMHFSCRRGRDRSVKSRTSEYQFTITK